MRIDLQDAGKRFNREWIFRRFNYQFLPGKKYAVTGPNGSGKSTLLQVIGGAVMHSEGKIEYKRQKSDERQKTKAIEHDAQGNGQWANVAGENAYRQISIAAPYLDLIEEMTAKEFLSFHSTFKQLNKSIPEMLDAVGLSKAFDKQIRYFSSGMKQRLKLAQAFFSDTSVLLLDEPVTNLDQEGIAVYKKLWDESTDGRLVIVSSNDKQEYEKCDEVIPINDYK